MPRRAMPGRRSAIVYWLVSIAMLMPMTVTVKATGANHQELPPTWAQEPRSPGAALYGVAVERDIPIRMSDGVLLRADLIYPTDKATGTRARGSFPVLLEQTPYRATSVYYSTEDKPAQHAGYFVSRGYLYVLAQVRGTYRSGGAYGFFSDREKQDGVELVNWVAHRLPASNGRVGLTGCSYPAIEEYFTAARLGRHSPVKAMATGGMGADLYRQPFFVGGAPSNVVQSYFSSALLKLGSASPVNWGLRTLADIKTGGSLAYDSKFWQSRAPGGAVSRIVSNGIPVLIWSGWNDFYPSSAADLYSMFQNRHAGRPIWSGMENGQGTTLKYQLIVGSGAHCAGGRGGLRDRAYLQWFDTWIKGERTGIRTLRSPLHFYIPELANWIDTSAYPLESSYTALFLSRASQLTVRRPSAATGSDRLDYEPAGNPHAMLFYATDPLQQGMAIMGPVALKLYVVSSREDAEIIARLFDVGPDGSAQFLSSGAITASMRAMDPQRTWRDAHGLVIRPYHRYTEAHPIEVGKVIPLEVRLQLRLTALLPGHKLRLVLSAQADPTQCDPNGPMLICPGLTIKQQRDMDGGVYGIQINSRWPSYLSVPLVPLSKLHEGKSADLPSRRSQ